MGRVWRWSAPWRRQRGQSVQVRGAPSRGRKTNQTPPTNDNRDTYLYAYDTQHFLPVNLGILLDTLLSPCLFRPVFYVLLDGICFNR